MKVPANSTSTTTKKRSYSKESDAGTPEQFPNKMFNVELFLTSNQAQCNFTTPQKQSEVDGSQGSEKDKMEQIQRRVKQSKRNITKAIEKFISNIEHYEKNPAKRRSALNLQLCNDYYIQNHLNTH